MSEAATNVKTATEESITDVKIKTNNSADMITTESSEAKHATAAVAQNPASTVQGKRLILITIL